MNRSHELAGLLLQRARDDRHVLELLVDDPEAAEWTVGFHAQQAVEKAIKAVLSASGVILREQARISPDDSTASPRLQSSRR